ncbi:hypothetical protein COV16_00800 [Candidatus Woesearchaeota archaeon CG10_big_fil_rev_8_21_14_0_10_34_8]|nr:MAG: hypothetical protein COV16_00800 [Candidatus Woesearchaeota archaeon CG10_big_fil_rev_8_21_14_0_10_34_8]
MFIEIGSSLENWKIKKYGDVIAEAIYYLVSTDFSSRTIAFGIGGTHYCSNFSKLIVRENYAFGHVCPKYQLDNLSWEMVEQALSKSLPKVQEVVIDWKGVSGHKDKIRVIMENLKNHSILVRRI